jgi:hypothetical protein
MSSYQAIQLLAVLSGLLAAGTLFYGTINVPDKDRSWDGEADHEKAREKRNRVLLAIGIPATGITFLCQLILIFLPTS